jgi:hypothetical protein
VNRAISYGTAIVLVHVLVNIVHGVAHRELHIGLGPAAMLFVIGMIMLCPLLAMVLLWTSQRRLGLILLALSMAGSFLFGLYNHFVAIGPDHVGKQASGPWGTTFVLTAYLLLFTEAIGSYIGLHFLDWKLKA